MKDYRLKRLFNAKSGCCFDVAVDHGFFNQLGFLQGIEDLGAAVETLGKLEQGTKGLDQRLIGPEERPKIIDGILA